MFLVLLALWCCAAAAQEPAPRKETLFQFDKPFPAPDFELTGEDRKTYRLSDYRGQVVILNFWTTWCPPCRFEMPAMERVWQQVQGKGIVILAVNMGETETTIFEFTGTYPVSFPIPMDRDGKVIEEYPVIGLPTTYIINPEGYITHRAVGTREWDAPNLLDQLLAMRSPEYRASSR
jgi:peroxiredoxin